MGLSTKFMKKHLDDVRRSHRGGDSTVETATESLNAVEDAMKSTFNCVIKIGEVIKLEQGVTHHGKKRTKRRRKASAKHAKGVKAGKSAKLDADKEKWKLDS